MEADEVDIKMTLRKIGDKSLRRAVLEWLRKSMRDRRTSESFAKSNPDIEITPSQLKLCHRMNKAGFTLRQIEKIMHLVPNEGNNAYRCIKMYEQKLLEEQAQTQNPINKAFIQKVLETLTLPSVKDQKKNLQEAISMLP